MSSQENQRQPDWIMSLKDMSGSRARQTYLIDGETEITLCKRWRDMMDTLRKGPVYCASPVRLSDAVHVLRNDYQVPIETDTTQEGRKFYRLACDVREVAA
ncbi:MAG: hypothetical protein AAFZ99_06555 [Pseudomonadota bacterium]